jgi:hypothetical protein
MRCVELGLQVARLVRGRVIVRRSGVRVNGGTHYLTAAAAAAATASLQGPLCVLQIPVVQRSVLSQRIAGVASAVAGTPSASPDEDTVQLQPSPVRYCRAHAAIDTKAAIPTHSMCFTRVLRRVSGLMYNPLCCCHSPPVTVTSHTPPACRLGTLGRPNAYNSS